MTGEPFVPDARQAQALDKHAITLANAMGVNGHGTGRTRAARRHRAIEQVERCRALGVPDRAIIVYSRAVHDQMYGRSG